jgi:hypothetical protein
MIEKWLYREQANYRLSGDEKALIVQCALGNNFKWIGSLSCLSPTDYRALRVPIQQASYANQEQGRFSSEEEAFNWIIEQVEVELAQKPYHFNLPVIPRPPFKPRLP